MEAQGQENSKRYRLAEEAIAQGMEFYGGKDPRFRENAMVTNFLRETEGVQDATIMGIYGSAHIGLDRLDITGQIPCMANQLSWHFKTRIASTDLSLLLKPTTPLRVDTIEAGGRAYAANYYGKQPLYGFHDS